MLISEKHFGYPTSVSISNQMKILQCFIDETIVLFNIINIGLLTNYISDMQIRFELITKLICNFIFREAKIRTTCLWDDFFKIVDVITSLSDSWVVSFILPFFYFFLLFVVARSSFSRNIDVFLWLITLLAWKHDFF